MNVRKNSFGMESFALIVICRNFLIMPHYDANGVPKDISLIQMLVFVLKNDIFKLYTHLHDHFTK